MEEQDNIEDFPGVTRLDINPERILKSVSRDYEFDELVILGFTKDEESPGDGSFFFSSSKANGKDVLWLLELAKLRLMGL